MNVQLKEEDLNRKLDLNLSSKIDYYSIIEKYGISEEEARLFWVSYYVLILETVKPRKSAVEVINFLKEKGHKIFLITARFDDGIVDVKAITEKWLEENKINYDKLIINSHNKLETAKQEDINLFIDDSIRNCEMVSSGDIKTYMFSTENNNYYENEKIEIASDFETEENLEMLKEPLEVKSLIGSNKVKTSIKEDIAVDNSYNVSEILKTSVEIKSIENKISYNKVLAKADAEVKIIFLSDDGRIGVASSNIPVMSFIDLEKVADTHTCMTTYTARNMLFKVNSKESHTISCQIEFEVMCSVYEIKTIDVIQDMYGLKNTINFSKKEIMVPVDNKIAKEK